VFIFRRDGAAVSAQTKTITNRDLEKFRQKRLQSERDYRENYVKLGFPSPEELDRRHEQTRKERAELAERIRRENLEREKMQSEAEYRQAQLEILENNLAGQRYNPAFITAAIIIRPFTSAHIDLRLSGLRIFKRVF
jgi:hypothetical protein